MACVQHRSPGPLSAAISRRDALFLIGGSAAAPWASAQGTAGKHLVASIPVLPWLSIGQTTENDVRGPVQSLMNAKPRPWFRDGASEITGGRYMSISSLAGRGVAGEEGLKILTMVFDTARRAQLAIMTVDKGWNGANVEPLIARMTARYRSYAQPVRIRDGDSEATDLYIFFDIGRFCIEIAIPQHGSYASVHFTTKAIHKLIRTADGTFDLFVPYLEKTSSPAGSSSNL